MVWPIHQVPRRELPEDFAQVGSEGTPSKEEDSESKNKDITPWETATPGQRETKFNPTARLEQCFRQRMGREDDHRQPEEEPYIKNCCGNDREEGAE